jgi:hypothetical protein
MRLRWAMPPAKWSWHDLAATDQRVCSRTVGARVGRNAAGPPGRRAKVEARTRVGCRVRAREGDGSRYEGRSEP